MDQHPIVSVDDRIALGGQPGRAEVEALRRQGFHRVINLRRPEEGAELSAEQERQLVEDLGMSYVNIPVRGNALSDETVDAFRSALDEAGGPTFVHCARGSRAAALVVMAEAIRHGWTPETAFHRAAEWGHPLNDPLLAEFVRGYLERRVGGNPTQPLT